MNEIFTCDRKMQNDEIVWLRSIFAFFHRVSMTVLQFTTSRDWETVKMLSKETVYRNRINLTTREKVLNSHQMLDYSDILFIYRLVYLFIYLSCRYSEATNARQR